jgi:hypothetical protein
MVELGRAPELDFVLDDPAISRRHARLTWRGGQVWLEDLGSRNGSFRNGRRIRGPERVTPGDRITLGSVEVRLEAAPTPPESEETPCTLAMGDLQNWAEPEPDRREALNLVHEVSLRLLKDVDPHPLLEWLLDQLFEYLEADRGAVLLRRDDGCLSPLAARARVAGAEAPSNLSRTILETTLERRAALVMREPMESSPSGNQGSIAESGTSSVMAVPLEHDGEVLGLFYFDTARLRLVATLCNLAAAKLLEQRMKQELHRREAEEDHARTREAAARTKADLLARISHEIRTPLNAVLGYARMARQEPLTEAAAACLDKIEASGRLLLGILNDVLDFSRLEAGGFQLERIPFDPVDIARETLDLFRPAVAARNLDLELDLVGGPPPRLEGDPLRLGQVLTNLVGNGVKFTERGTVRLRLEGLEAAAGTWRLTFQVQDTGIGIDPERMEQLFRPYAQAGPEIARNYGGTGLGLAISQQLVERMGGTLTAESQRGEGSRFSFTLDFPAVREEPERQELQGRRILLVEDDPLNQDLAQATLASAGAVVQAASTGEQALALASGADLILMDLDLPGWDGLETARRMRAAGLLQPILALTGDAGARDQCLAAGMDELIAKPIAPARLLEALARIPGRAGRHHPALPTPGTA